MDDDSETVRCKDSEQRGSGHPMKSYVHDQAGNDTEAFAYHVKELEANTSELFTPSVCPFPG